MPSRMVLMDLNFHRASLNDLPEPNAGSYRQRATNMLAHDSRLYMGLGRDADMPTGVPCPDRAFTGDACTKAATSFSATS